MSSLMTLYGLSKNTKALPEKNIETSPTSKTDDAVNTVAVLGVFASLAAGPAALFALAPKALKMISDRFSKKPTSNLTVPLLPMKNLLTYKATAVQSNA
jgi:hypothetical protein